MMNELSQRPVLLITGMSGSGRSFALKVLEDMGYETIDNLPLSFLETVTLAHQQISHPLAISIDIRTRDFSLEQVHQQMKMLTKNPDIKTQLIFFECDDDVLARRYNETRRFHPLAYERPVIDGIRHERHLISPLKNYADLVIDTTLLLPTDLRGQLRRFFSHEKAPHLSIFIISFSFRQGLPREADIVFDARLLKNPYYIDKLRPLSGENSEVATYIQNDAVFSEYFKALQSLLSLSLPRFIDEGRGYLTIAVGCTGGQHRSVFIAKLLKEWLQEQKNKVKLRHRDLKKS